MSPSIRITVTVPKEILNVQRVRDEILTTMLRKNTPELISEFRKTTEGWKTNVRFSYLLKQKTSSISLFIKPVGKNADIYSLVNNGSPAHKIFARNSPTLRFQEGYVPSTSPRVIGSRRNRRFGRLRTPLSVSHPGFEAREFDDVIAEKYTPVFERDMQDAINRGSQ